MQLLPPPSLPTPIYFIFSLLFKFWNPAINLNCQCLCFVIQTLWVNCTDYSGKESGPQSWIARRSWRNFDKYSLDPVHQIPSDVFISFYLGCPGAFAWLRSEGGCEMYIPCSLVKLVLNVSFMYFYAEYQRLGILFIIVAFLQYHHYTAPYRVSWANKQASCCPQRGYNLKLTARQTTGEREEGSLVVRNKLECPNWIIGT